MTLMLEVLRVPNGHKFFAGLGVFMCVTAGVARARAAGAGDEVAAVFNRAGCRECHNPNGVASDTRLVFPDPDSPPALVATSVSGLRELIDGAKPEDTRLYKKPLKVIAHEGGQKIAPGSPEEATLVAFLRIARDPQQATRALAAPTGPGTTGERVAFRRLTHAQYDNTVRDLLGTITSPARQFPPEDFVDGFLNQSQGQSMSPVLAEAYSAAAQRLAQDAVTGIKRGDPRHLLPCRPSAGNRTCRERFVRAFGRRAFRRPLGEGEVERFSALFAREKDFMEGARVVIETMLQAPSFLYMVEWNVPTLMPYARASRLAYFLWNTMPDEALLAAAEHGELDSDAGVAKVARAMVDDPRAQPAVDEFTAQWLRLDQVRGAFKDRRAFPMFTPELSSAMAEETRRFVSDLAFGDKDFREVFSARHSIINADLAALYGLPAPADGFAQVAYPATMDRAGVLGQAAFLAGTSKPADTSPTARGLFVREHFLCQKVPTPPPGVNMNLPPLVEDKPTTNRDRLKMHLADESCARCHNLIDTIGFAFEKFDAVGRRQEVLKVTNGRTKKTVELPLDTHGGIAGIKGATFSTVTEVGKILHDSSQAQQCVARQVYRYALGRHDGPADRVIIDRVFNDWKKGGFRFKELLVSVARWIELGPHAAGVGS